MWDSLTESSVRANRIQVEAATQTKETLLMLTQQQQAILQTFNAQMQATLSQLGSFMSAVSNAAVQDFRNSQEKQIEALEEKKEKGIISEEEFQKRRQELEDKTQQKIAQEQRKAAQRQKALSIFQSITNTAVAVTKALAQSANPVLAGIIGAAGAAQTALIAAQPIPEFATGGSFVTNGPQLVQVGDNPGGREQVSVEPVSSEIGGGSGAGGGDVYLDGEKVGKWLKHRMDRRQQLIPREAIV